MRHIAEQILRCVAWGPAQGQTLTEIVGTVVPDFDHRPRPDRVAALNQVRAVLADLQATGRVVYDPRCQGQGKPTLYSPAPIAEAYHGARGAA